MKSRHLFTRILSMVVLAAMLVSFLPATVFAADEKVSANGKVTWEKTDEGFKPDLSDRLAKEEEDTSEYKDTDVVRVSIILSAKSTLAKGFKAENIAQNSAAMSYRASLKSAQASMEKTISEKVLGGSKLDVVWNMTLAANIISANVPFGKIEAIKALAGIDDVVIERRYEPAVVAGEGSDDPSMATSGKMIGSNTAWAQGYTGAGSKVAIIDTGVDTDHQSFDVSAYEYALEQNAKALGVSVEKYKASLNLLDVAAIAGVYDQLNFASRKNCGAEALYVTSKIPFGANYVDKDLDITHDNDGQGEHGSHVTGIATANRYIPAGDGSFDNALDTVCTQGVAPDAQIIAMKVFGKGGGAYDSDYMVAIEDAVILGADSVNLSLGSGNPGLSKVDAAYAKIMNGIAESGTVVSMSAGNSGYWAENATYPYLYSDGVSFDTAGSPGSFTNSLTVASVDNDGTTGTYFTVDGGMYFYSETSRYGNKPLTSIAGTQEYVFFDNVLADGNANSLISAYADVIKGKVVFGYRGTSSFYMKANAAAAAGAIATIICNNQAGVINMDLEGYTYTAPCVSILQADAAAIKAASTPVKDADGKVLYYTGTIVVGNKLSSANYDSDYYTMSSFSSWGVPGSLELKPEITAPGGNIYSVNGAIAGGKAYESMSGTSMASPQVAGMAAVLGQYIRENDLTTKTGLTARQLINALLMSTATPLIEEDSESYYSVLKQGAGLANVGDAIAAETLITVNADATSTSGTYKDGKVKVELGDDPDRTGKYTFSFNVTNFGEEAKGYDLDAAFFTQDVFNDGVGYFLDTGTAPLDATVSYDTGNKPNYDFNGDGVVNDDDADAILDYVVGNRDSLNNAEYADLNGDGAITSRDAYVFLAMDKDMEAALVILPGQTAKVTVTVTLKDVDDFDDKGAYVEGYVFVNEIGTDDEEGQSYSIPVLGYYGDWTEPSMYDVGGFVEYYYKLEDRVPYLYDNNNIYGNAVLINHVGEDGSYYFGGNPFRLEDKYQPERNAMNSTDKLAKINYTLIRNAKVTAGIFDADGNAVAATTPSNVSAAFYYTNGGSWQYTNRSATLNYSPVGVPDGTQLNVAVVAAPEYKQDANGNIKFDELADGAYYSIPFVVDNTAPEVVGDVTVEDGVLKLSVKDNQYIAAVIAYTDKGVDISLTGPDCDAKAGDVMDVELDVGDETRILVQIYDYANNCTAYKINLNEDELANDVSVELDKDEIELVKGTNEKITAYVGPFGIRDDAVIWTSDDESVATVDANGVVTAVGKGACTITAAAHADPTKTATCEVTVVTFDIVLNGVLQDESGNPKFFTWDMANDKTWKGGKALPSDIAAFVWDEDLFGTGDNGAYGYLQSSDGSLYKVDMESGAAVESVVGMNAFGAAMQDMAIPYASNYLNDTEVIFGVCEGNLLYSDTKMANTFTSGWPLASHLANYTGSSEFTALAWIGIDSQNRDVFAAMTDNGAIWYLFYNGSGSIGLGFDATEAADLEWAAYDGQWYNSMVYSFDLRGYVLSHFNGTTNEICYIDDIDADVLPMKMLGNVGDDVWPAALYEVVDLSAEEPASVNSMERYMIAKDVTEVASAESEAIVKAPAAADGSLNAVKTSYNTHRNIVKGEVQGAELSDDDMTKIVIDVNEEVDSNNSVYKVTYNATKLTYVGVDDELDHIAVSNTVTNGLGVIKVAYADLAGLNAGDIAFSALFTAEDDVVTNVRVEGLEVNEEESFDETVTVNGAGIAFERLDGPGRTDTAAAIAAAAYDNADTVFIANGDNYADALAGAPLAYAMDAPILLVRNNKLLDAATLAEMKALGATKVVILGGSGSVSDAVVAQLKENGYTDVERVSGANRYDTAVAIADKLAAVKGAASDVAFVTCATNYPDALAVSSVAGVMGAPILYAGTHSAYQSTIDYIKDNGVQQVYVIGGTGSVSDELVGKITDAVTGLKVERVAGSNRYATCLEINTTFADVLTGDTLCVATGTNFPDALVGGVYAAKNAAPMLLVPAKVGAISEDMQAYVADFAPSKVVVFGGTGTVSADIADEIMRIAVEAAVNSLA